METGDTYTTSPTSYAASPNWALGVDDAFADHPVEKTDRRNHFTIRDAREAMYRALTGTDSAGKSDIGPETMTSSEIRKAYWATTFRALGDVLHLLQDTSQPQHTRNDLHSGVKVCFGAASAIEKYVEARAKDQPRVHLSGVGTVPDPQPLDYGDYPIPSFARYSDYFSTARRETGTAMEKVAQGKGLADYSNRGFFTTGKNFGNTDYPLPVSDGSRYQTEQVELHLTDGIVQDKVLIGDVPDTVQGTVQSAALTSEGVLDEYLRSALVLTSPSEEFSLQPANYDADAELLLPRAVAYSAGLLNYFFRGHFDLAAGKFFALIDHSTPHSMNTEDLPIDSNTGKVFGFTKFKIKVRNDTNDIVPTGSSQAIPQEMTDGFLQAVVKYNLNHCYRPDLTGQFAPGAFPEGGVAAEMATVSTYSGCNGAVYVAHPFFDAGGGDGGGRLAAPTLQELVDRQDRVAISKRIPIGPGHDLERIPRSGFQPIDFDFRDDPIPVNARDIKLQIVYRGKLGSGDYVEDDAVVVTTVDISEPSYITFTNSSDYVNVNGFFLSYGATVPTIQTLASNLRSTGDAEDEAEAENLEHRAEALIDPDVPITDFTCKDSEGDPDLITFQSLQAKRFVRVAALVNTRGNTQLDLCTYKVSTASGVQVQRLAVFVAARVNEDYYDRDKDLFLFKEFPQFRGVVQKQGSPEFYENFAGWSAVHNVLIVREDLFPPSDPPQKIQDIPNPINPQPSPVSIRCDYTWDDCPPSSG